MLLYSLVLFAVFASFLGGWGLIGQYWPVLLILLGLIFLGVKFLPPESWHFESKLMRKELVDTYG